MEDQSRKQSSSRQRMEKLEKKKMSPPPTTTNVDMASGAGTSAVVPPGAPGATTGATAGTSASSSRAPTPPAVAMTAFAEAAKQVLGQLMKMSKMGRSRGPSLAERPEVQAMLEKDLFMIGPDRRTKMNPLQQFQLVRVLAQFFLERNEDGHGYTYFEAIFLGRSDDAMIQEYRISVLYQLISFSAQYPILQIFNHTMGWLCQMKNEEQERAHSDRLIAMIHEHYVRLSVESNRMHDYLVPLEMTCCEFCALFIARAPLHGPMKPPMCELIVRYCTRNMQFLLRHLRDTPWLGNDFAEKVVPKIVEQALQNEFSYPELDSLVSCLCYILMRWHVDTMGSETKRGPTKRIEILDLILSPKYSWTKGRAWLLTSAIGASARPEEEIVKSLEKAEIPEQYKQVVELLSEGGVKEDTQKFLDSISEMRLTPETIPEKSSSSLLRC